MSFVKIENTDDNWFIMDEEDCELEISPWFILNSDEIGTLIAYNLFDAEYNITQEILDEEINDFLSNIHERIIEKSIQVLKENGRNVD